MRHYEGRGGPLKRGRVASGKHGALACAVDHAVRGADASSEDLLRGSGTDRNTAAVLKPSN